MLLETLGLFLKRGLGPVRFEHPGGGEKPGRMGSLAIFLQESGKIAHSRIRVWHAGAYFRL
jgi:hypothetical protein